MISSTGSKTAHYEEGWNPNKKQKTLRKGIKYNMSSTKYNKSVKYKIQDIAYKIQH